MENENNVVLVLDAIKDLKDNFLEFVKVENERWEQNERRWEENDRRWEENERRWAENDKRWEENDKRWAENDEKWDKMHKELKTIYERLFEITESTGRKVDDHEVRIRQLERNALKVNV